MKKFFKEFQEFINRGNVMDMAVGVIVGGMFTKIVNSFTNDILMPFISLLTGRTSFENMFAVLKAGEDGVTTFKTLEEATAAGATVVAYGNLIQLILDFVLTAFVLFLLVKVINKIRESSESNVKKLKEDIKKKEN